MNGERHARGLKRNQEREEVKRRKRQVEAQEVLLRLELNGVITMWFVGREVVVMSVWRGCGDEKWNGLGQNIY